MGITDVDATVLVAKDMEDEVLMKTTREDELLVAVSVLLVRLDSMEDATKDEDVESMLLSED